MTSEYIKGRAKPGEIDKIVTDTLQDEGALSNAELADITGKDRSVIIEKTKKLESMGIIRKAGKGRTPYGNVFFYYALVTAGTTERVQPKKESQMASDSRRVKRRTADVSEVPFLKWWEGGGLYANLEDSEARLAA